MGNWIEYYKNGQIREKINLTSQTYESYFEDGKPCQKGFYRNDKKHGDWTTWNKDGKIIRKNHYEEGSLEGLQEVWTEDGNQQLSAIEYKNNKKNGTANGLNGFIFAGQNIVEKLNDVVVSVKGAQQ